MEGHRLPLLLLLFPLLMDEGMACHSVHMCLCRKKGREGGRECATVDGLWAHALSSPLVQEQRNAYHTYPHKDMRESCNNSHNSQLKQL